MDDLNFFHHLAPNSKLTRKHSFDLLRPNPDSDVKYKKISFFDRTPPLPSYLHNFSCGVFGVKEYTAKSLKDLKLRIFYRHSYQSRVDWVQERFFECLEKAIKFYEEFFGIDYPFQKYDSIFLPDQKYGAMEFPGAVTFKETSLPTNSQCDSEFAEMARIIFHETAHMWFGNNVTMKWWDDLWLNESFAEYIAFVCFEETRKHLSFEAYDAWEKFVQMKEWGYREDGMPGTHPILPHIGNTEQAESMFDGITYSKGAAVMKQIVSLIGMGKFKQAMQAYFQKFKWKNADINDLFGCLQEVAQSIEGFPEEVYMDHDCSSEDGGLNEAYNILQWKNDWIHTAGTNVIRCEWDRAQDLITIHQMPYLAKFPTLRYHKIKVRFPRVKKIRLGSMGS